MIKRLIELMRACSLEEAEANVAPSDNFGIEVEHERAPAEQAKSSAGAETDFRIYCGGCC